MQQHLEELSVQQLVEKHSFVIPEIQREYVWGNNDQNILDKFFADIKEGIRERITDAKDVATISALENILEKAEPNEKDAILKVLEKYKKDMNIGFLYSYKPDYYLPGDRGEDAYLIDGQQRFTTLFLALFYFSLKDSGKREDFLEMFRFNPKLDRIAFDYRVRSLTHHFLMALLLNCKHLEDLDTIPQSTWFLSSFAGDVTVRGMLGTLKKLDQTFRDEQIEYYQFIKKQIKFWHFKTEETSQGEELYITMNSRGQQLADNETIRATLFDTELVKHNQITWGAKWEKWQDFFWTHRDKGANADFGLNQFLRWVNVIEYITRDTYQNRETAEKRYKTLISENVVLEYVTLSDIEPYFNSLERLATLHKQKHFGNEAFKGLFNPEWICRSPKQGDLIILLPALMLLKKDFSTSVLCRYLRFFANAAKGADVSRNPDTFIVDSIQLTKAFLDGNHTDVVELVVFSSQFPRLIASEETWKLNQLASVKTDDERSSIEESFWKVEDYDSNKGKIGHIIQASFNEDISNFTFKRGLDYSTLGDFDLEKFCSIHESYKEVLDHAALVWGDLITSSIYSKQADRLVEAQGWHLHDAFIRFTLCRNSFSSLSLNQYIFKIEKEFVREYKTTQALQAEQDPARQLYLYYILLNRVYSKWNWKDKWNIGIYDGQDYPSAKSPFAAKYVYQFYNTQWRYNVGYEIGTGVWLQDNFDNEIDYFLQLLNWANSGLPVMPPTSISIESEDDNMN